MTELFRGFIPPELDGTRIDRAVADVSGRSRARVQQLFAAGRVWVDGRAQVPPDALAQAGSEITLEDIPEPPAGVMAESLALEIVFEDDDVLVINKPAGMVVHPAPGNRTGTLANGVLGHCAAVASVGAAARPGIVHRLDKDTSGLIVVAKTNAAHAALAQQFQPGEGESAKQLVRAYAGIVWGETPLSGSVHTTIARHRNDRQRMCAFPLDSRSAAGKEAITHYVRERCWRIASGRSALSLLRFQLQTGRTHQIRVHCQFLRHPIVGDPVYGKSRLLVADRTWPSSVLHFPRQALHACSLSFLHPRSGTRLTFSSPLPDDMQQLVEAIDWAAGDRGQT